MSGCVIGRMHSFKVYLHFSIIESVWLFGAEGALNAFLLPSLLVSMTECLKPTAPCEQNSTWLSLAT